MYGARRYGKQDASIREGPPDDHPSDAFYELLGEASDLRLLHSGLFPEIRRAGDDRPVFRRHCNGNSHGPSLEEDHVQRRGGSLRNGASQLPPSRSEKCGSSSVGQGKRFPAESVYHYLYRHYCDLVPSDLRSAPERGDRFQRQYPGNGGGRDRSCVRAYGLRRLEGFHSTDHGIYGKRECGFHSVRSFRKYRDTAFGDRASFRGKPSRILPSLYALCGGRRLHQA